jgi:hypothetical protein
MSLVENDFRKFGLTGHDKKKEDPNETIECIFKCEYLNYINFCDTKKIFTNLKEYYENILKEENIEFSDLFHKLEYKLSMEGMQIKGDQEKNTKINTNKNKEIISMDL